MDNSYDLVVIGAGMAGLAAAQKCAGQGWHVAIVDSLPYGGTCALRGCDPKKLLRRGAEVIENARLMRGKGIDDTGLSVNWSDLIAHKNQFTDSIPAGIEDNLKRTGVTALHGAARFTGRDRVDIDGTEYRASHFLIATGAKPSRLMFPGHEHVVDSTQFMNLAKLPPRILFLGGGFISFEFAHLAARIGSVPTIIDRGTRPLKRFDPDLVERLVARGTEAGIGLRRSATISSIERAGSTYRVTIEQPGGVEIIETDLIVHGAGRVADLSGLDLGAAGVDWSDRGVRVAGHLQSTTNPTVWAAGDSADTAGMPLTPVGVSEGKVAASNMLKGTTTVPDYIGVPTVVFTIPELARVGLLEEEARSAGIDLDVRSSDTGGWYSNYRIGESSAAVKILIDKATDTIVGAHMFGPEYAELVNVIGLAIKLGLTTRQLKSATAAYPSVGSDLGSML